jgi:hypothetical protein
MARVGTTARVSSTSGVPFQRFSDQLAGVPTDDTLFEGMPPHIEVPLREWIAESMYDQLALRVCLRLKYSRSSPNDVAARENSGELLDVVAAMLWGGLKTYRRTTNGRYGDFVTPSSQLARLSTILNDGGSAYRVRDDKRGLERRTDAVVSASAKRVIDATKASGRDKAAQFLRDAWTSTYGLHPEPGDAYADAVRAVEEVSIPLLLPRASAPTLGAVRSTLDQGRANYELVIADKDAKPSSIDMVVGMISTLWFGHRDRHAGHPTSISITQESAEMALHTAITLVHYFNSGAIRRAGGATL